MLDSYAIIYAPGVDKIKSMYLVRKIQYTAECMGFSNTEIQVNPEPLVKEQWKYSPNKLLTLIIGWGLPAEPSWNIILGRVASLLAVQNIYAVDLFERRGIDGRILNPPRVNAGKYWSRRVQAKNLRLFFKGYYIKNSVPYGMKRAPVKEAIDGICFSRKRHILKPGESSEIEIVKLIFDLFVNHDYNRTQICNLLNSQRVEAPNKRNLWNTSKILTILKSPLYVGANQYHQSIIYNVFTPIIEKSMFFETQSRISLFEKYSQTISSPSKKRAED
jgi:hypothetical protein